MMSRGPCAISRFRAISREQRCATADAPLNKVDCEQRDADIHNIIAEPIPCLSRSDYGKPKMANDAPNSFEAVLPVELQQVIARHYFVDCFNREPETK